MWNVECGMWNVYASAASEAAKSKPSGSGKGGGVGGAPRPPLQDPTNPQMASLGN